MTKYRWKGNVLKVSKDIRVSKEIKDIKVSKDIKDIRVGKGVKVGIDFKDF